MSQYVTKLSQAGATGVLIVAGQPVPQNLVLAGAQQGYKPQWILPSQQPAFYKSVGAAADGLISYDDLVDSSDTTNADAAVFRTAMAKWEPSAALDAYSIMTFSNIVTLARLGNQVGGDKITRAGLPALLASIKICRSSWGRFWTRASTFPACRTHCTPGPTCTSGTAPASPKRAPATTSCRARPANQRQSRAGVDRATGRRPPCFRSAPTHQYGLAMEAANDRTVNRQSVGCWGGVFIAEVRLGAPEPNVGDGKLTANRGWAWVFIAWVRLGAPEPNVRDENLIPIHRRG